jgi:hypothetical protein
MQLLERYYKVYADLLASFGFAVVQYDLPLVRWSTLLPNREWEVRAAP